ncbi:MAG: hypothetical protein KME07_13480 [Pegethrix bostrychoides GSE-TBD4-15B]|jgi:hypothetical protein|uniref:Uncharacterized protein n=1 Tax=Pegethrix bostrychoides GSE-TBD4-15B TaxID=2839662 RepID=A0A951PCB8_9CYAN|nr:hypothetical protein [Pegethrix bostrychoides GSE-TBD4-15B]
MDSWSDYYNRRVTHSQTTFLEEQYLYDHLLECVRAEPPEALIDRFQMLFISGSGYSDYQVWQCLKKIIDSPYIEKDFKFILNRSLHIFINHWLMQSRLQSAIPELVALFEADAAANSGRSRTTQRLKDLVQQFRGTEQYLALQRLSQLVKQTPEWGDGSKPLGTLIRRYPCLYKYNLLTADSSDEQCRRIRQIRRHVQRQFERELSQYATHKLLNGGLTNELPQELLSRSFKNPTLLSDRHLDRALQQFGGKIDGSNTYRDQAQRFITYSSHTSNYRDFKADLYDYLVSSIDSKYGNSQFNQRLCQYLQTILPEHHEHSLNDVLLIGTCRKLLNFLVVENAQNPNHAVFVDLTGNLGITTTISLLLKIVLICRKVKPYLEKQFSVLFKHYETCTRDSVTWLIDSLESLNVAFSINFGGLSL